MKRFNDIFEKMVSLENLFAAWDAFVSDKKKRRDVRWFEWRLEQNIFSLHRDLQSQRYQHGPYSGFFISDPKPRQIHKATVRDRIVHHAVFTALEPIFEPTFIPTSFSCRRGKGTHSGVSALEKSIRQVSQNYHRPCFVLKCDVKKFFASVDHTILLGMMDRRVGDERAMLLIREIVESYEASKSLRTGDKPSTSHGLPIGNLTSQLFANIYLNQFDQFVKHQLGIKHYLRYTDDFIVVHRDETYLRDLIPSLTNFLAAHLKLMLHPDKIFLRKCRQGVDFLGYVLLPHYRRLRTKTKRRIFRKLDARILELHAGTIGSARFEQSFQSYLGVLSHADEYQLSQDMKNRMWA